MAGGNLDRPGRSEGPGEHAGGRRGGDSGIDRGAADRLQAGVQRLGQQTARRPAVAGDEDCAGGTRAANAAA